MFKCFSLIVFTLGFSVAYKILLVFPFPIKSHSILGEGYVRSLLKAGHEVTYITPYPMENASRYLRQIDVSDNKNLRETEDVFNMERVLNGFLDLKDKFKHMMFFKNVLNKTLWNPSVRQLMMNPKEQFDLVIVEWLHTELSCGLAAVFNCPLIWSSSMEPHELVLGLIDEVQNPAYTATMLSTTEAPYTLTQRVQGFMNIIYLHYLKWSIISDEIKIYEEAYSPATAVRGRPLPRYQDIKYNASLMFGNSHVATGFPIRLPQNYKPISGYHIEDVKPLPEDFKNLMDGAQHGVIYFSMGTLLKISTMPDVMKRDLLNMFGGLNQTVIWKIDEELREIPKNVHTMKWTPQASILAHPNCILFITHCGLISMIEAVNSGVPIIGVPMFADQFINIDRAVKKGVASKVEFTYDFPSHLKTAIEKNLHDKRYRQKMQELSSIYRHRPVPPGAELVHWVEHVVRTCGAPHLRSLALNVPFYQKYYLDLMALLLPVFIVLKKTFRILFIKKIVKKQKTN